jgi:hypothetical protein
MALSATAPVRSILVKVDLPEEGIAFALGSAEFRTRPLFQSIGRNGGLGVAPTDGSSWHIVEPTSTALDEMHLWDACHALLIRGFGIADIGTPEFAEPNLEQRWPFGDDDLQVLGLANGCVAADANQSYPHPLDSLWYRDAQHADFDAAKTDGTGVRIAHLDTGYDPQHKTVPAHLRSDLQWNFVEGTNDATDRTPNGILSNFGHGTGTLSILAGKSVDPGKVPPFGAARGADIVPIRVANSVVLFQTSTVAQGFDYVHKLASSGDRAKAVDILTMSMGGLASQAWADAVNALYDIGVFIVTAAGNNYGSLPTRNIVFPARFRRVVAACGAMADLRPYADLHGRLMAGNYGPDSKMDTAMAAYTPNVPWAKIGCESIVNQDGNGTSAATPQIAAAAALWTEKYRAQLDALPEPWMKVEAIRTALFGTATNRDRAHFGRGTLDAAKALASPPTTAADLRKNRQPKDSASMSWLRVLTGVGITAGSGARQRMLELEALQLSQSSAIESLLPDPQSEPDPATQRKVADAIASDPRASASLRKALAAATGPTIHPMPAVPPASSLTDKLHLMHATAPNVPTPKYRTLRIFAVDPSMESSLDTVSLNEACVDVRWEQLDPGPVGEYIEVIDVDPASEACYAPIDLDDPRLLAQSGRRPAEGNAQFHQQMVYAVSMKTIEHFERALGRVALWSPHTSQLGTPYSGQYVQRLRIYPHALREANAFYSPDKKSLLFGYFTSSAQTGNINVPGTVIFGCLSYDIIAHETTHALLDGLHRRFRETTNRDMAAFHEAFADIVALFQHFTVPEALRDQIAKTRGDLEHESLLGQLAFQFGQATNGHGALRDYIGSVDDKGAWKHREPQRTDYANATEVHDRGAVLVAAVFDAFLRIYQLRFNELARLATGGTGVLPEGHLPDVLVDRLAEETAKLASQWLDICIRALDYCPPVDLTFGDYLRAIVTADADVVPDDTRSYRVAFVSAFRDRGIYAESVRNVSVGSLLWEPPPVPLHDIANILSQMSLGWDLHADRRTAYERSAKNAGTFRTWLMSSNVTEDEIAALGLQRFPTGTTIPFKLGDQEGEMHGIEVHSVRPARRVGPDGQSRVDLIVEITQTWHPADNDVPLYRGGVTLIIDLETSAVRYLVRKRVDSEARFADHVSFAVASADESLRGNYFQNQRTREPFAMVHRLNPLHETVQP